MGEISICRGEVRGQHVEIGLIGDRAPYDLALVVMATGNGEGKEWLFDLGGLVNPTAEGGTESYTIRIALSDLPRPVFSLQAGFRKDGQTEPAQPDGKDWHLGFLAPRDDREFTDRYTWEGQRIRDGETLRFSLHQTLEHISLSAGYFVSAAVMFAYRAVEADATEQVRTAIHFLKAAIPLTTGLESTRHVRTDRDHLLVSTNTALWHASLFLEEYDNIYEALVNIHQAVRNVSDPWSIGYNGAKGLLLYSFLLLTGGHFARAQEVNDDIFALFQRAAASSRNDNPTLFNDFRVVHRAAFLGMVANRAMKGLSTPNDMALTSDLVSAEVFRIRSRKIVNKLTKNLKNMEEQCRTGYPEKALQGGVL